MSTWNKVAQIRPPITTLYPFYKSDGTRETLCVSQNKLQRANDGLTPITGTLESDTIKCLAYKNREIGDVVLIADQGRLKVYDGTNVNQVSAHTPTPSEQENVGLNDLNSLTNFRTFVLKKDRVYAAANPAVKNRVSFSYFDPYLGYAVYDYFPATYFFDVAVEDNDEIVELRVFRDALIIFCKRSVWALLGNGATLTDLQLIKLNVPSGCISPGSVQEVGNNLFYLSDTNVFSLYSTEQSYIASQVVSANVQPILQTISIADKEKATSAFYDDKYYLSFPSGLTLVYDAVLENWTRFTNIAANSFMVLEGELYFSHNSGFIYRFNPNIFSDDGMPIDFSMKTKILDFDFPIHRKKLRRMWLMTRQWSGYNTSHNIFATFDQYGSISLNKITKNEGAGMVWDVSSWDEALWDFSEVAQDEIKLREKAKSLQLEISNSKADEPITVFGVVFEYQLKKP